MIRLLLLVLMAMLVITGVPTRSWCAGNQSLETSSPQEVVEGISGKLVRGVTNVATGWVEFPKQIYVSIKEDGKAKGIVLGPLKGIGMTIVRSVVGVVETATFFLAFPGFYDPYIEPAYVWQKE